MPELPCNGSADLLPGKYTDHTMPKYPFNIKGTKAEKDVYMSYLLAFEKLEEVSRKNFELLGCFARVSFHGGERSRFFQASLVNYDYQLGVYKNVCHATQRVVKTADEYRTVFRVLVNKTLSTGVTLPVGTSEFFIDKSRLVRYDVAVEAKLDAQFENNRMYNPSRISQYLSEADILASRSTDYKNKHRDFLKIINGDGYVENWLTGSQYDKPRPNGYKWVDRHYLITKPGVPLLVPVSRKQFLEDLLAYLEIERYNFFYSLERKYKENANDNTEYGKKRTAVMDADRKAYPLLYEAKKSKIKQLLATQTADWLAKQAVVDRFVASDDANQYLEYIGKFYEVEDEQHSALYVYNPQYFKVDAGAVARPQVIEVQFRYEQGKDEGFSERLFANFLKNYDLQALRKMIQ